MIKTKGIVIRSIDYKEKDKLITVFTPNGLITASARSVRSPKSKLKQACGELFFGEMTFTEKGDKKILSGAEPIDTFYSIWGDYDKMAVITYCFELTEKCFEKDENTDSEFVFFMKLLKEVAYGQTVPCATALRYAVFCAESFGVDYSQIEGYNHAAYEILTAFSKCSPEDCGDLPYREESVKQALALIHTVFKNDLNFRSTSIKIILR